MGNANEREADKIDCELFRLQTMAERVAEGLRIGSVHRGKWNELSRNIRSARSTARSLMHKVDVENTQ